MVNARRTQLKNYICPSILVMLLLIFFGCAGAPKPVTIKHREEPKQVSAAVTRQQDQKPVANGDIAALVDMLKSKKVISADEAARFIKQDGTKAAGESGTATASEGVGALVGLLKSKNVINASEADQLAKQYGIGAAGVKVAVPASETSDKEKTGKISSSAAEEVRTGLPAPVINDEQRDVPQEVTKSDKEQIEKTPASITGEVKKDLPAPVRNDEQRDVLLGVTKSDKERIEKITASVTEELKKGIQEEEVKIQAQEEKTKEITKTDKISAEKIAPGTAVEMKNDSEPSGIIVIGNRDTKRYHLPGMPYYNKVKKHHRVLFESEQKAIESGYYKAGTGKDQVVRKQARKESIEKPNAATEPKKDLPEPVKNEEQKDVLQEVSKSDKEQIDKTPASITGEVKKDLTAPVKTEEQKDIPQESVKSDKEQSEKTPASITREVKKDLPEPVKTEEQKDVPQEVAKSDKEQVEKITAIVTEELKKGIQEEVKVQVQEEVSREIKKIDLAAAAPEWTKRIRFGGDIRLRYESDRYDKNNATNVFKPSDPTSPMNTTMDKDLYRYRVRLQMSAEVNDKAEATFRLATGNETNPVSTNTVLGNNFNKDKFLLDMAYLKIRPWEPLTIYAGRMPNPWFSSDLVWDHDLNFDGIALTVKKTFGESWIPYLTVGVFPLQETDFSQSMKYLTAAQVGLEKKSEKGIGFKIGAAYYDFHNITGVLNDFNSNTTDWTAPAFQQKGNTLFDINNTLGGTSKLAYASEFNEFNVTGELDINFWNPYRITLMADYVKNLGFNKSDVIQRTGNSIIDEETVGYQVGMSVGYPTIQQFGQWKVYLYYKYLEADAVVDAYTDSDFHLGGTNAKGWILGTDFGLSKNIWLTFRWLTADAISGPPLAIDVFQADLNARF